MNDKTLVEMLAGWSGSEFAVAASGEYCEDLKSRIEGVSAAMNDKWCGDGLAESEQIAFMRSRIEALEAALRKIAGGAKTGEEMFKERLGERKSPTWFAVNVLQDSLAACHGTAERALESKL